MSSELLPHPAIKRPFKHPSCNDLYWLLQSPPLFDQKLSNFARFCFDVNESRLVPWLSELESHWQQEPTAHAAVQRSTYRRLGLYFEALAHFCLTHGWHAGVTPYQLVQRNIQVAEKGKTLGEVDALVRHADGTYIHIEMAVKYYLAEEGLSSWDNWIGPNASDRLDLKMHRLVEHQLPLLSPSQSHELLQQWQQQYGFTDITSQHLLRGVFFSKTDRPLPEQANADVLVGEWYRAHEVLELPESWRVWPCKKLEWLTGPPASAEISMLQLKHQIAVHQLALPLLVFYCKTNEKLGQMIIVPNHWPEKSTPSRRM